MSCLRTSIFEFCKAADLPTNLLLIQKFRQVFKIWREFSIIFFKSVLIQFSRFLQYTFCMHCIKCASIQSSGSVAKRQNRYSILINVCKFKIAIRNIWYSVQLCTTYLPYIGKQHYRTWEIWKIIFFSINGPQQMFADLFNYLYIFNLSMNAFFCHASVSV